MQVIKQEVIREKSTTKAFQLPRKSASHARLLQSKTGFRPRCAGTRQKLRLSQGKLTSDYKGASPPTTIYLLTLHSNNLPTNPNFHTIAPIHSPKKQQSSQTSNPKPPKMPTESDNYKLLFSTMSQKMEGGTLKGIDWEKVAADLGLEKGAAAELRWWRFCKAQGWITEGEEGCEG